MRLVLHTWEGLTNRRWSGRQLAPKAASHQRKDAGEVAQTLFNREAGMIESTKSTLLFPYFAQWFSDGFLAADQVDRRCNLSRHEIDLSQLYGLNHETTQLIREQRGAPEAFEQRRRSWFEQITSDSSVLSALKSLYSHPDEIEFYPGLFAEDLRPNSALGPLVGTLVGIDAFSQALTNPLLHSRTFCSETFSPLGWQIIHQPQTIEGLVRRNTPEYSGEYRISMTRHDWKHS